MATASPLPPDSNFVRISDNPEAVQEIARRAEALAAKGFRGKSFLQAFGLENDGPNVVVTTTEELDTYFASDDGCAPSS